MPDEQSKQASRTRAKQTADTASRVGPSRLVRIDPPPRKSLTCPGQSERRMTVSNRAGNATGERNSGVGRGPEIARDNACEPSERQNRSRFRLEPAVVWRMSVI